MEWRVKCYDNTTVATHIAILPRTYQSFRLYCWLTSQHLWVYWGHLWRWRGHRWASWEGCSLRSAAEESDRRTQNGTSTSSRGQFQSTWTHRILDQHNAPKECQVSRWKFTGDLQAAHLCVSRLHYIVSALSPVWCSSALARPYSLMQNWGGRHGIIDAF